MYQSTLVVSMRLLAELPEFDPPPDLWGRILARRQALQRRRRLAVGGAIAASVAALALLVALRTEVPKDDLAALQAQSQRLEARLSKLNLATARSASVAPTELRSIEQTLQYAYDRAATNAELAPLWQRRNELLDALIATSEPGALVTRL